MPGFLVRHFLCLIFKIGIDIEYARICLKLTSQIRKFRAIIIQTLVVGLLALWYFIILVDTTGI